MKATLLGKRSFKAKSGKDCYMIFAGIDATDADKKRAIEGTRSWGLRTESMFVSADVYKSIPDEDSSIGAEIAIEYSANQYGNAFISGVKMVSDAEGNPLC